MFTTDPAGFEIKGLYIECNAQKNGANVPGDTGYDQYSYGISDVTSSQKRYMGPLHIKVFSERCGWDLSNGETLNEVVSATHAEIDIVLDNEGSPGGTPASKTSLFTDIQTYIYQ